MWRSGMKVFGETNETKNRAKDQGLPTGYLDAKPDKKEIEQVKEVLQFVDKKYITHFKPEVEGFHGSKTLWKVVDGHETFWKAIEDFLKSNYSGRVLLR